MALAMNHHNAYVGGDSASVPLYRGDGSEPPPAPSVRELVERCLQGRIDSDPEVNGFFFCQYGQYGNASPIFGRTASLANPLASSPTLVSLFRLSSSLQQSE